jgi:hypothetical protein
MEMHTTINDDFFKLRNEHFALYGASSGGEDCYKYLKGLGLEGQIACFIDKDITKQGSFLYGKNIYGLDYLAKNSELVIIITSMYIASILKDIHSAHISNLVYAYLYFIPEYSENIISSYDIQNIKMLYDNDDFYTERLIETAVYMRNADICRIQTIDTAIDFSGSEDYWCDDNMPHLDLYNDITVCDCGAFCGDTLEKLYRRYGARIRKYFGFEPSLKNYRELQKTVDSLRLEEIASSYQIGLGNSEKKLGFVSEGLNPGSHFLASHLPPPPVYIHDQYKTYG